MTAGTMTATRWYLALHTDDLWEGDMTTVTIEGAPVLVLNVDGHIRAYSNQCPHQGSPLDVGELDGDALTCATHLWVFNALTGEGINPRLAHLKAFPCDVRDDGNVYVQVSP